MKREKKRNSKNYNYRLSRILEKIAAYYDRQIILALLVLFLFAGGILIFRWMIQESPGGFTVNFPAQQTYRAVIPVDYIDEEATELFRDISTRGIEGVTVYEPVDNDEILQYVRALNTGEYGNLPFQEQLKGLLEGLSEEQLSEVLNASGKIIQDIVDADMPESPAEITDVIWGSLERMDMELSEQNIVFQVISSLIVPESSKNTEMTEELKTYLRQSVEPVSRTLSPGEVIVQKGDKITPRIAEVLRNQGYPESSFPLRKLLIFTLAILLWITWFSRVIKEDNIRLAGKYGWLYISILAGVGWTVLYISDIFSTPGSGLLVITGLSYLTLPKRVAFHLVLGVGLTGSFLIEGFSSGVIITTALMAYVASLAGYYMVNYADSRALLWQKLFACGVIISSGGIGARWVLSIPVGFYLMVQYLLASAVWSILILVILPLFENLFDVLSPLRLIELSQPSHLLLKKLQIEAPGTYHHSLMVSTLAEAAAEKLGLDTALIKAGAYYHDIGKLKRPQYYVENQVSQDNIHDSITPSLSALSIIAHVREGIEIGKEYKLPTRIIDFISEHHGTTCLSYFYRKAKKQGDEGVTREQFCYPGPKPASKETGLLMIVDSVEAAVRADIQNIQSRQDVEKIINNVVENKMGENQLENVDFTLRELRVIKDVLLSTLQSMYHTRKVKQIRDSE